MGRELLWCGSSAVENLSGQPWLGCNASAIGCYLCNGGGELSMQKTAINRCTAVCHIGSKNYTATAKTCYVQMQIHWAVSTLHFVHISEKNIDLHCIALHHIQCIADQPVWPRLVEGVPASTMEVAAAWGQGWLERHWQLWAAALHWHQSKTTCMRMMSQLLQISDHVGNIKIFVGGLWGHQWWVENWSEIWRWLLIAGWPFSMQRKPWQIESAVR